jgi:beta-glucanase (GH16 family)
VILALLACTDPSPADTAPPADTAGDSGLVDTGDTGDTADTGDSGGGVKPLFDEPFDTIDRTRWLGADWVLGATQFDPRNAHLVSGGLNLVHLSDGAGGWTGAELYTSTTYAGGLWEAGITPPESAGTVCAFFLYTEADGVVNEIDVELLGSAVWFSVYRDWTEAAGYDDGPAHLHAEWPWPADFDKKKPHTFTVDWGVDAVAFGVDGLDAATLALVPSTALGVHVNHWTSTTWAEVAYPPPDTLVCRFDGIRAMRNTGR